MPFYNAEAHIFQFNEDGFDFNIQFEQVFFSVLPSVLFIISSLWRTFHQSRKPAVVHAPLFQMLKAIAIAIYLGLELALLVLVATGSFHTTGAFIAASALKLVSALVMIVLSIIDHSRSPRPSILLSFYLTVTLLLDAAQARTLFLSADEKPEVIYSGLFCATVALKVLILILEAKQKTPSVHWNEKEHSPEETSGLFSIGVFFWLNKMFVLGYRKVLNVNDLYPLDKALDSKALHDKFSGEIEYSKLKGDKFGLVKVLTRTLAWPLLIPIIPRLALLGFTLCQPLFMERLLDYLSQPTLEPSLGYGFIGASFFIYTGMAISMAIYWYFCDRLRTMIRSVLVTEIYLQATKARFGVSDDSAALTLMSTDMERIRSGMRYLHEIWASLLQAAFAAWMLYNRLGVVFVAPIGIIIAGFIALAILTNYTGDSQRQWMAAVQERVGLTATVISSMKNLKISGLSAAISGTVQKLRVDELSASVKFRILFICAAVLGFFAQLIGPPITFALLKNTLDVSTLFTSLAFLTLLTYPLSYIFEGIPSLITALACLGRIQSFLECETREDFRRVLGDTRQELEKPSLGTDNPPKSALIITNGNFGWRTGDAILRNVNVEIPKAALTMVVGPVGSGKSTFCKALLGEIPFASGNVVSLARTSHIGFCEQAAFLSNGSVKDNIIGFSAFDQGRYSEVVDATSLGFDIATFPNGDQTNIGSDGITLSGGQKQRLSLARALYLQSDMLVLDDIFSGLDADTEEKVFRQVFASGGLIRRRGATVVLCTHSVKHLPEADHVIVLGDGTIAEQGSYVDLMTRTGYVRGLDLGSSSSSETSTEESSSTPSEDIKTPVLLSTTNADHAQEVENDMSRQVGDKTVYKHYVKSMGLHTTALALLFGACWGFFTNFPTIWLTYWTNDAHSQHPKHSHVYYAGVYGLLQVSALLSLIFLAITLWVFGIKRAGANLHQEALRTLIRAPLRFFTRTDTGIITNLFSQDLNLIDTELPESVLNILFSIFQSIGQMAIMLTSSPYLAIAYPFLGIILYIVGRFYLRTSRQLRLLDLETKSPLYTHFLDTVKGITTLRALGFVSNDIEKNVRLINTSQRPAYLLQMIQEWLNMVLAMVVMVIAVILVVLSIQFHAESAFAGASLYSLITLGENLAGIVLHYTRLETSIGAIARLKKFNESVKPEDQEREDVIPSEQWPHTGAVQIAGVSAAYDEDEENPSLALRDINLKIDSGEKVAICGRTGSGKSSLVALLLKLLNPIASETQQILIDDVPLSRIDRAALRQRLIAVPQEAVFLPDGKTFQANLDPYSASTTQECRSVLEAVGLWTFVQQRGGLNAGMTAGSFSAGQRQLFSVARALLRRRIRASHLDGSTDQGILLLDEVSSSVDRETEIVIQKVIESEFSKYTVIAVSHRLDMIMDFDRVIVMDKGNIIEIGKPIELAAKEESRFGDLVWAGKGKRN